MSAFRLIVCKASLSSASAVSTSRLRVVLPCTIHTKVAFGRFRQMHYIGMCSDPLSVHVHVQTRRVEPACSAHAMAS